MGNCSSFSPEYSISLSRTFSLSVSLHHGHEFTPRSPSHLIKNNKIAPAKVKTVSTELADNMSKNDINLDDDYSDYSTFSLIKRGMKNIVIDAKGRRGSAMSVVSALTMDDAMLLLDQEMMLASHRPSRQHDDNREDDDDDEVKLTKEMIESYLLVINDDNANISDLFHQLHQIDVETQERQFMSPREAQIQREKRNSLVLTLREEFRLAMTTSDAETN